MSRYEISDFDADVLQKSRQVPVLVDFWAAWCGPCRTLGPTLERMADRADGRWTLAKVDTEANPDLAQAYRVQSIPYVLLFVDGKPVDGFVGALPESEVQRFLDRALPSPRVGQVVAARALLERGAYAEAAAQLEAILAAEPGSREARLALAEARLHLDPSAVRALLEPLEGDPDLGDKVDGLWTLARLLVEAAMPGGLPEGEGRGRYAAGLEAVRAGQWAMAFEAFIDVLKRDRGYGEGRVKDAGRALFLLLGPGNEIAERYQRPFASALFV